jgi:hypothetical protein
LDDVATNRGVTDEQKAIRSKEFENSLAFLAEMRKTRQVCAVLKCPVVWWNAHPGEHGKFKQLEVAAGARTVSELRLIA